MVGLIRWWNRTVPSSNSVATRLNSSWTAIIFLVFGIVAFLMQMAIDPIACWAPAEYTVAYVTYTNKHCWYANRIIPFSQGDFFDYPSLNHPFVSHGFSTNESNFTIYQWIPLILLSQALLFKLPDIIWKCGMTTFGVKANKLFGVAEGSERLPKAERKLVGKQIARYLFNYVESSTLKGCPWGLITLLYIFVKFLYFANVLTQFTIIRNHLLTDERYNWMGSLHSLNETNANYTPTFPKSVFCDFSIRQLQNVQKWRVQCDLPINQWYYSFYAILWIWLLIVLVITIVSCLIDAIKFIIPIFRKRFMKRYLSMIEDHEVHDAAAGHFASRMGQDIVIILKILAESAGEIVVGETVIGLWEIHTGHSSDMSVVPGGPPVHQGRPAPYSGQVVAYPNQGHGSQQPPGENVPLVPVGGGNMYPKAE